MLNFSLILLITVFVCAEIQFLVYSVEVQEKEKQKVVIEPPRKYPWVVEENERKVEKLVVEYSKNVKNSPAELQRKFSIRLPDDWSGAESENRQQVDISNIPEKDKLFMCAAIIRMNYFGLEFKPTVQYDMEIMQQNIWLQRVDPGELATHAVPSFPCPELQYIDLETGEPADLLTKYFISGTHLRDSFFLYLQEASDLPLYPHKYASEVKLDAFDEQRVPYELAESQDKATTEKMKVHDEIPRIEKRLTEYLKSRKSTRVYEKFRKLYKSFRLCGTPRVQVIALCRYIAHNMDLEIDYRGYDEFKCHSREVFYKPPKPDEDSPPESLPQSDEVSPTKPDYEPEDDSQPKPDDSNSVLRGLVRMIKCPAVVSEIDGNKFRFHGETMFVSANRRHRSVFMLKRSNVRGSKAIPEAVISALRLPTLRKDQNRKREFPMPQYPPRKPRYSDLTTDLIRLSGLKISPHKPPAITFQRNAVEDNTILLTRIKEIITPYDRFIASYKAININMWPAIDIAYLCHIVLRDESYNLAFESNSGTDENTEDRVQIQVQLLMRDMELLRSKKIIARQCPSGFQTSSTYFIVGTIFNDAITVHVKYENENYAFPEASVQNIDKVEVQAVARKENLFS